MTVCTCPPEPEKRAVCHPHVQSWEEESTPGPRLYLSGRNKNTRVLRGMSNKACRSALRVHLFNKNEIKMQKQSVETCRTPYDSIISVWLSVLYVIVEAFWFTRLSSIASPHWGLCTALLRLTSVHLLLSVILLFGSLSCCTTPMFGQALAVRQTAPIQHSRPRCGPVKRL